MKMFKDKDKKDKMSDNEMKAKKSVLEDLRSTAQDMMKDKLGGLKKVSVASNSPMGLEEGLKKAQAMIGSKPPSEEDEHMLSDAEDGEDREDDAFAGGEQPHDGEQEGSAEEEAGESPEDEEHEGMSEDELNEKIQKLMAIKSRMKK